MLTLAFALASGLRWTRRPSSGDCDIIVMSGEPTPREAVATHSCLPLEYRGEGVREGKRERGGDRVDGKQNSHPPSGASFLLFPLT